MTGAEFLAEAWKRANAKARVRLDCLACFAVSLESLQGLQKGGLK
jgi:hypothetical protein